MFNTGNDQRIRILLSYFRDDKLDLIIKPVYDALSRHSDVEVILLTYSAYTGKSPATVPGFVNQVVDIARAPITYKLGADYRTWWLAGFGHRDIVQAVGGTAPDVVLLTIDERWMERAIIDAAERNGIPVVLIQDGITLPHPRPRKYSLKRSVYNSIRYAISHGPWQSICSTCRSFEPDLSWGIYGNTTLGLGCEALGIRAEKKRGRRWTLTGLPQFDSYANISKVRVESTNRSIRVLYTSQPFIEFNLTDQQTQDTVLVELASSILEMPDTELIVRPHPDQDINAINEILKKYDVRQIRLDRSQTATEAIINADIVIAAFSTTLVEAFLLDRKVALLECFGIQHPIYDVFRPLGNNILNVNDISRTLKRLSSNLEISNEELEMRNEIITGFIGPVDGLAAKRVAELIVSELSRTADC